MRIPYGESKASFYKRKTIQMFEDVKERNLNVQIESAALSGNKEELDRLQNLLPMPILLFHKQQEK